MDASAANNEEKSAGHDERGVPSQETSLPTNVAAQTPQVPQQQSPTDPKATTVTLSAKPTVSTQTLTTHPLESKADKDKEQTQTQTQTQTTADGPGPGSKISGRQTNGQSREEDMDVGGHSQPPVMMHRPSTKDANGSTRALTNGEGSSSSMRTQTPIRPIASVKLEDGDERIGLPPPPREREIISKDYTMRSRHASAQPQGPPPPNALEALQRSAAGPPPGPTMTGDGRQLNVTDALSYLDAVKLQFHDNPDVYNHFLDIMKEFKSGAIDTPGVIERVSSLFAGFPALIQGFNTFLPVGYRIECSVDAHEMNMITVTTPSGTTTQSTSAPVTQPYPAPTPHARVQDDRVVVSDGALPYTQEQISPAMEYVQRIKQRLPPELYLEFLNILERYKRPGADEAQLYLRISRLFQDMPDLLADFQGFAPMMPSADVFSSGEVGIADRDDRLARGAKRKAGDALAPPAGTVGAAQKKRKRPVDRENERERERDREEGERELKMTQSKSKRQKHVPAEPQYPPMRPPSPSRGYLQPQSQQQATPLPYDHLQAQAQSQAQAHPQHIHYQQGPVPLSVGAPPDHSTFFDRVRRSIDTPETYNEFLKLINLFTQDIIDVRLLVEQSNHFIRDPELMMQFREILGWDEQRERESLRSTVGMNGGLGGVRVMRGRVTKNDLAVKYGPSYRRLPASEANVPCSGRDDLCRAVLNDEWVSHPAWAGEESGFVPHKKNPYEEALHRSEEERHEYDFHIDAIARTITVLEPVNAKIAAMSPEERAVYKLKAGFGGSSKSIHQRIIKKIYGKEAGLEVIQALHDAPALAVPVVLTRLRQKEEEWKRAQREWNKVWREVDARNYQRSLDHQGITFKASDKKATTTKAFVNQIESAREEQMSRRAALVDPLIARTRPKHQMEFAVEDMTVLQDMLKLCFVFLDRMHHHITNADRRRIENFLRSFVPIFFMLDSTAFNTALRANQDAEYGGFGPEDFGIVLGESEELNAVAAAAANARNGRNGRRNGAGDLRKKVLKGNAQDKSSRKAKGVGGSNPGSRLASPAINDGSSAVNGENGSRIDGDTVERPIAVRQTESALREGVPQRKGSFYSNATLYTLIRLVELLYARLNECKTLCAKLSSDPSSPYLHTHAAAELGLLDVPPADVGVTELQQQSNPAAHFYDYLLDTCEKLFDNEIDQQTFEDIVRYMFGTKAYIMFTVDKVIGSIIKQVQLALSDNKCLELLDGLKRERELPSPTSQDQVHFRLAAERIIGPDENLFRVDWLPDTRQITVQLLGKEDSSYDDTEILNSRWQTYVESYVSDESTKGVPTSKLKAPFLARNLRSAMKVPFPGNFNCNSGIEVKVCVRTYRLFFVPGAEDCLWREWPAQDLELLQRRSESNDLVRHRWLERLNSKSS